MARTNGEITLYGAEISLYSGKARAALRFKGLPFREVLATREVIEDVLYPNTGKRMVPVVRMPDGRFVQDTTVITDALEELSPQPSVYPAGPVQRLVALLLEVYGDEWLLLPAMHYRWHYKRQNLPLVLREFGELVAPRLPSVLHPAAGLALATYFGGAYGTVLGISRRNRQAIERRYEAFLDAFEIHLAAMPFLLGSRPSVGDLGFIGPLYAHLYRDAAPGALMRSRAPAVAQWVERMQRPSAEPGDFLPDDVVPETLEPMLRHLFEDYVPTVIDTMRRVASWHREHPEASRFPRFIGRHEHRVDGVPETRSVTPYSQWMWQRPLRAYQGLSGPDREQADALLRRVGGLSLMEELPEVWVSRVNNRIVAGPGDVSDR